jgi:hypothetical protein
MLAFHLQSITLRWDSWKLGKDLIILLSKIAYSITASPTWLFGRKITVGSGLSPSLCHPSTEDLDGTVLCYNVMYSYRCLGTICLHP